MNELIKKFIDDNSIKKLIDKIYLKKSFINK